MGVRKVSIGLVAAALLGTSPVVAATAPASQLSLAPMAGARVGASHGHKEHLAGGGVIIGVLAAAAVAGGVVAATSGGHHHGNSASQ